MTTDPVPTTPPADDDHERGVPGPGPVVSLDGVTISRGGRTLVRDLDLRIDPGEFVAVLGPNGAGKTSLLKVLLGEPSPTLAGARRRLRSGTAALIWAVPQQRASTPHHQRPRPGQPGIDGTCWGPGWPGRRGEKRRIVEVAGLTRGRKLPTGRSADVRRRAAARACGPAIAATRASVPTSCCSARPHRLRTVAPCSLPRRCDDTAIVFVTHEINPVLPMVDRVLYIVDGRHRIGTPDEVFTSEAMSDLYSSPVEVLRVRGQIVVVGDTQHLVAEPYSAGHHHHDDDHGAH